VQSTAIAPKAEPSHREDQGGDRRLDREQEVPDLQREHREAQSQPEAPIDRVGIDVARFDTSASEKTKPHESERRDDPRREDGANRKSEQGQP
jgi:hypothetical protein